MGKAKVEIDNWEDAEVAAQEYVELNSRLELLAEQIKEFAERRHDQVGRERVLGRIIIGFEKVAAQVKVPSEAMDWLQSEHPEFVEPKPTPKEPTLKKFIKAAASAAIALFRDHGIVYTSAYERFFLRLANARRDGGE